MNIADSIAHVVCAMCTKMTRVAQDVKIAWVAKTVKEGLRLVRERIVAIRIEESKGS